MKTSQRLKQSQSQVIAPQLQLGLKFLQAPAQELRSLLRLEIESNPTLEELSETETEALKDIEQNGQSFPDYDDPGEPPPISDDDSSHTVDKETIRDFLFASLTERPTLYEHFMQQLQIIGLKDKDIEMAEELIGMLDEDGYLPKDFKLLPCHYESIIALRKLNPVGCFHTNLRDCLLAQIPSGDCLAYTILTCYFTQLIENKLSVIASITQASFEDVMAARAQIRGLNPFPGRAFSREPILYATPDLLLTFYGPTPVVSIIDDHIPRVRISSKYRALVLNPTTDQETRQFLVDKIRSGKGVMNMISERNSTLLKVASEIMIRQVDFFHKPGRIRKPIILKDIAEAVGYHETTISRAVSNKYIETPFGMYPLGYFFVSGFAEGDASVSEDKIKKEILSIVNTENKKQPYNDESITVILNDKGIPISRRTVAKYRLSLNIPPSYARTN